MASLDHASKNRLGAWMGVGTGFGAVLGALFHHESGAVIGLAAGAVVGAGLFGWAARHERGGLSRP